MEDRTNKSSKQRKNDEHEATSPGCYTFAPGKTILPATRISSKALSLTTQQMRPGKRRGDGREREVGGRRRHRYSEGGHHLSMRGRFEMCGCRVPLALDHDARAGGS